MDHENGVIYRPCTVRLMIFGNLGWREAFSLALESGLDLASVMEGWLESRSAYTYSMFLAKMWHTR